MAALAPERKLTTSKLPSFRSTDLLMSPISGHGLPFYANKSDCEDRPPPPAPPSATERPHLHLRNQSAGAALSSQEPSPSTQTQTHPQGSATRTLPAITNSELSNVPATPTPAFPRNARAKSSSRGRNGPPPLSIQRHDQFFDSLDADLANLGGDSTRDWVSSQSPMTNISSNIDLAGTASSGQERLQQEQPHRLSRSQTEPPQARPLIKPIRGFKLSSQRKSTDMASRRAQYDEDRTLRTLEGDSASPQREEHDEHNSDESDLFLRAAREEELQASSRANLDSPGRSNSLRARPSSMIYEHNPESRLGQRASHPSSASTSFQPSTGISHRRGNDQEGSSIVSRSRDDQEAIGQALTYRPEGRDRPAAPEDFSRNRYSAASSRSTPTTPRGPGGREMSPDQSSFGGRRPSIPEGNPSRSYRQSNLSYSTPRTYNSSPLVSRTTDLHEVSETPRAAEGTESTVSTTAPSTVWDELEDLKSRIHRLELTGKLPPTSGAAMSRASHDRPPTATTTVTTMSSSPKQRGRGNSLSPIETAGQSSTPETHPLLYAALEKAKPLLSLEVFKALEATAADALAISSMMGSSGQPGPISSAQSTIGGTSSVSDRQVRRKADSMCRSLTEMCLALSEIRNETVQPAVAKQTTSRPNSGDIEVRETIEGNNTQRQLVTNELSRIKSSPRALSRLEARRSSLLGPTVLPAPRFAPSEVGAPAQSSMAGRRTSMLLRSRRAGTEEQEDEDETRFRAPSRATTDIAHSRNSPREYTSSQPLPERLPERTSSMHAVQSSLPVRRHYQSPSLPTTIPPPTPPISALNSRRYLDRSTPERDTTSVINRLAEDRGQRKSSMGLAGLQIGRTSSITRRSRQPSSADFSAQQQVDYQ